MKKIYLLAIAFAITESLVAQSIIQQTVSYSVAKEIELPTTGVAAADPTDTLGISEFGSNAFIYSSPSGFVFGTNDLEDTQSIPGSTVHQLNYEFAGGYIVNGSYNVLGAMILFAGKEDVTGNPGDVTVNVWSLADNKARSGATAQTPDVIGPNQVRTSATIAFSDIDTVLPTFVTFANSAWVNSDFAIGIDIEDLYGNPADTVALIADEDGDGDGTYTWTKFGFVVDPPLPQPIPSAWFLTTGTLQGGLDVNLGVFAIVSESLTSIEEQGFLNGVKMTTYPNPALTSENVRVDFGLEAAKENVELTIYTLNGQVAYTTVLGSKASGIHSVNIPAGTLSAGSYVYALVADGARIAKRMEILK
jgi:hypothetical protein